MYLCFVACNRLDYPQNIPEYIAHMHQLQQSKPGVWYEFENGGFTVNTNPVPFTAIGVDQAKEHINKVHKGHGCISGLTNSPEALLRYCLSTPVLARLADETEQMLGITQPTRT